ncbi:hypothetical protein NQK81_41285 [Amycolatopsis roodepoortensis]|uniref:hypothetical protein n=1 Tax=Amycolatopsis roodepoortensis TaxID=700274 RepID=UPI00214A994E|nr:hypothetical protein [Amycolatopsis roodepoortensis]UUV31123.1 hypothetical protein NQK81_41285 [Amycolatopsis roodepoortensis]
MSSRAGTQPVFLERLLLDVEMRRGQVHRRLAVRTVIACEHGVDGFRDSVPVKAIIGCRAETSVLRFPKPLRKGERHEFVSLVCDDDLDGERQWINVDVDHHGIAPGAVDDEGKVVGGLNVSITFDDRVPEACWWYAEQTECERVVRPPAGDRRLLEIRRGVVEHTFAGPCRPREQYGIAFR